MWADTETPPDLQPQARALRPNISEQVSGPVQGCPQTQRRNHDPTKEAKEVKVFRRARLISTQASWVYTCPLDKSEMAITRLRQIEIALVIRCTLYVPVGVPDREEDRGQVVGTWFGIEEAPCLQRWGDKEWQSL